MCLEIVKQLQNNVTQCKIAKTLNISLFTVYNINNKIRESYHTIYKGQGNLEQFYFTQFNHFTS